MKSDNPVLADVIKWQRDPKTQVGNFVIASDAGYSVKEVDELLSQYGRGVGDDLVAEHVALAAAITEPILQAVAYKRWTSLFFEEVNYGDLEDNRIPIEYYTTTSWQTGPDAEVFMTRPGFAWTRPTFVMYSAGVEMGWSVMARAGWNVLSRVMQRTAESISRQIDLAAQSALDVAIDSNPGQGSVVSGGLLTKAGVDALIKAANAAGFPLQRAVINSGTLTDMTAWSGGPFGGSNSGQNLPESETKQMLQTLSLGSYGGIDWFASPFAPTNFVYFGGPASSIGYEQTRGTGRTASDVDIRKLIDYHIIISPEYAWYIGNALALRRLRIAP